MRLFFNRSYASGRSRASHWQCGGFTMLELLVVVAILAIMASVALLALEGTRDEADTDIVRYEMTEIRKALRQFRHDVGHFPDAASGVADNLRVGMLVSCQNSSPVADNYDVGCQDWDPDTRRGWNGPYVTSEALEDPWGPSDLTLNHRYRLLNPENDGPNDTPPARLLSHGPNGTDDGSAALTDCSSTGDDVVLCLLQ